MKSISAKHVVAFVASAYFLWCAYDPYTWRLLDGVNLIIHEAGHLVFMPGGQFLMIAGGSLFQVIVPAVFAGYFFYHARPFSAAIVLFWVGHSTLNVSVYASDALALQLPLLGGDDSTHDWNYLLSELKVLPQTPLIGGAIRLSATLVILAAAVLSFVHAQFPHDDFDDQGV